MLNCWCITWRVGFKRLMFGRIIVRGLHDHFSNAEYCKWFFICQERPWCVTRVFGLQSLKLIVFIRKSPSQIYVVTRFAIWRICMFRMIPRINIDCFQKAVVLYNSCGLFSLWGRTWSFVKSTDEFLVFSVSGHVDVTCLLTRVFSRSSGRPKNRGDLVLEFRRMCERNNAFLYCSSVLVALFVGLAMGYTQTDETGYAKEALRDKFQVTRVARLGNTIKVR
jgi:hypothetical protein